MMLKPPSLSQGAAEALKAVVGPARFSQSGEDRLAACRDMWPLLQLDAADGRASHPPDAVVWPESAEEVSRIIRAAGDAGVNVIPFGAGSGVCGGAVAVGGGITVDMKRMNRLIGVDDRSMIAEVEAGTIGEILERDLNALGWTLGHFPSSIYCSSVGGWVAARSAGQFSGRYGKIEDMLRGVQFVTGEGEILNLPPGSNRGVDLEQTIAGSEGIFGILTKAWLRIRPVPESRLLRGFMFRRLDSGVEAMRLMFRSGLRPSVARLYDPTDTLFARSLLSHDAGSRGAGISSLMEVLPEELRARLPDLKAGGLKTALSFPRLLNAAASTAASGCLLVVGFEGNDAEIKAEMASAFDVCAGSGGEDLGEGPGKAWFDRRYSVSYKQSAVFAAGAFADTFEVAVPWSRIPALYKRVRDALSTRVFVMAHFSHAYQHGCSIYFTFSGEGADRAETRRLYLGTWQAAMEASLSAGATLSHHHGVGLSKAAFMREEHGEGMRVLSALKRAFDPRSVMNRGKLGLPSEEPARPGKSLGQAALRKMTERVAGKEIEYVDSISLLARVRADAATASVEAGLRAKGLTFGLYPPGFFNLDVLAAVRKYGLKRHCAWDPLVAVCAVLADGTVVETKGAPRSATGPDIARTIVSGEGISTVAALTIRVEPLAPRMKPRLFEFSKPEDAVAAAKDILCLDLPSLLLRFGPPSRLLVVSADCAASSEERIEALAAVAARRGGADKGREAASNAFEEYARSVKEGSSEETVLPVETFLGGPQALEGCLVYLSDWTAVAVCGLRGAISAPEPVEPDPGREAVLGRLGRMFDHNGGTE